MRIKLDVLGVEAFVAIAEQGGFQKAANAIHITQTALTRRLQNLEALLGAGVSVYFSQIFFKAPEGGGPKPAHQDNFYFGPTDIEGIVTAWIALDDATLENGCLYFGEGTNQGPIYDHIAPPGEPLMSNLGPSLAWVARRPIIHLALTPGDVDACRRLVDFRHVVTVFRDPAHAWTGWTEAVRRPGEAPHNRDWNIVAARSYATDDGFTVVWFDLGVLPASLAADATARGSGVDRP